MTLLIAKCNFKSLNGVVQMKFIKQNPDMASILLSSNPKVKLEIEI